MTEGNFSSLLTSSIVQCMYLYAYVVLWKATFNHSTLPFFCHFAMIATFFNRPQPRIIKMRTVILVITEVSVNYIQVYCSYLFMFIHYFLVLFYFQLPVPIHSFSLSVYLHFYLSPAISISVHLYLYLSVCCISVCISITIDLSVYLYLSVSLPLSLTCRWLPHPSVQCVTSTSTSPSNVLSLPPPHCAYVVFDNCCSAL